MGGVRRPNVVGDGEQSNKPAWQTPGANMAAASAQPRQRVIACFHEDICSTPRKQTTTDFNRPQIQPVKRPCRCARFDRLPFKTS